MARPIEATPAVKGKDAVRFIKMTKKAKMTHASSIWVRSIVEESKKAEERGKASQR